MFDEVLQVHQYLWSVRHDDQTTIKDYHFVAEEFYIVISNLRN